MTSQKDFENLGHEFGDIFEDMPGSPLLVKQCKNCLCEIFSADKNFVQVSFWQWNNKLKSCAEIIMDNIK